MSALGVVTGGVLASSLVVLLSFLYDSGYVALVWGVGEGGIHGKETREIIGWVLEPTVHSEGSPGARILVVTGGTGPVRAAVSTG